MKAKRLQSPGGLGRGVQGQTWPKAEPPLPSQAPKTQRAELLQAAAPSFLLTACTHSWALLAAPADFGTEQCDPHPRVCMAQGVQGFLLSGTGRVSRKNLQEGAAVPGKGNAPFSAYLALSGGSCAIGKLQRRCYCRQLLQLQASPLFAA